MIVAVLALSVPLRAEDDGGEEPRATSTSIASEAARDKGYAAEAATPAAAADEESAEPIESRDQANTSIAPPHQRPLGAASGRAANAGGGVQTFAAGGAGISCDKSDPALTRVIREDLRSAVVYRYNNNTDESWLKTGYFVLPWSLGINEAISYKFTAPKTGRGGFSTGMGRIPIRAIGGSTSDVRPVSTMMTVSETACDFDEAQARLWHESSDPLPSGQKRKQPNNCTSWSVNADTAVNVIVLGQATAPGENTSSQCWIKPGKTYYLNIRTLGIKPLRDACASDAKILGPDLQCGGILRGSLAGIFDNFK